MIKKLERHIREEDDVKISCPPEPQDIMDKINELVDAVNALVYEHDKDSDWYDDPKHREQPADPYAEQRRWIGKLCKFWDNDENVFNCAILAEINEYSNYPYVKTNRTIFKHCEPVKPTDSIIYKGE